MTRYNKLQIRFLKIKRRLKLRNMPIVYEFAIAIGLIFIFITILSAILLSSYRNDKEKSTLAVLSQMNSQTINKVDDYINNIVNLTKVPLFLDNLPIGDSQNSFLGELKFFNQTDTSTLLFQKLVEQTAYIIFNGSSYINSVFVYNLNGQSEFKYFTKVFPSEAIDLDKDMWFKKCNEGRGSAIPIGTYSLSAHMNKNNTPYYVFGIARGIMDLSDSKVQGSILVNCSLDLFRDLCKNMLITPDQRITIINEDGSIIYDTEEANITRQFTPEIYDIVKTGFTGAKRIDVNGIKYMVTYESSSHNGWKVVNMVSENELFKSINATWAFITVMSILLMIVAIFLAIFLSRQIISPLKKLILLMKLVEKGNFEAKIKINNKNEIGQLAKTFNNMARRIKSLINEVYIDKITQKDLELKMLQNQINPHFLYNTLESIHMVAEINNDNEASQMSRSLGRILRYGINIKENVVTVRQEINNLNDYILLQKVRFSRLYDIIINVNEEIYENRIIKLILQPLVENAVYHGLDRRSKGGRIEVTGYTENDCTIFEVTDNGAGMEEKQVEIINKYINDLDNSMNSVGLKNIHKRIQLYYGSDYGIVVSSTLGIGTNVKVILPSIKYTTEKS